MIKIKAESIRSPRWTSKDGRAISCMVKFSHVREEHVFIASRTDCEEHGREIWARCVNGEFGEIMPYIPVEPTFELKHNVVLPPHLENLIKFLDVVNIDNANKSFKSVVISWGAMLDDTLSELLNTYINYNSRVKVNLNDFNQKIKSASRCKLIIDPDKIRLNCVRHIRNEIAHSWQITLDNKIINKNLRTLYDLDHADYFKYVEDIDFLFQMIYAGTCSSLVLTLKNRIGELVNKSA